MKECTLQEAIELCKKNGGRFGRSEHIKSFNTWWIIHKGRVIHEEAQDSLFELWDSDFESTWIYEPPKQSVFQEWNKEKPSYWHVDNRCDIHRARKEGWNAAIDAVQKMQSTAIIIAPPEEVQSHQEEFGDKIKALKEK